MTKFEDFITAFEAAEERCETPPDRELREDEMCALFLVNKMMRKDEIFGAIVVTMINLYATSAAVGDRTLATVISAILQLENSLHEAISGLRGGLHNERKRSQSQVT